MSDNIKKESIIYVNFAPYENAGSILDYLIDNFKYVALFSFNFHHLGKKGKYNKLKIFYLGKQIDTKNLFDFHVPEKFVFFFLPIRSFIIMFQIFSYSIYLKYKYKEFYYYFTVNAFTAWVGNVLKKIGLVTKTVFWVYDYYPPFHEKRVIAFMRRVYWQFDKFAAKSDRLIFLNNRVANLRKEMGILADNIKYKIIPIGTTNTSHKGVFNLQANRKIKLVYLGVVKKNQGLDLIFNSSKEIIALFPNLEIDVIGAGPDLEYFKRRKRDTKLKVNFNGYLLENEINKILRKVHIGIATYIPSNKNVAFYGDPSKIKRYLSFNLPVITTNVFEFSK